MRLLAAKASRFVPRGAGTGPLRRLPAARGAGDDLHQPHEAHRRDRRRQPPRRRRGRRRQPGGDERGAAAHGLLLRARSVEPAGVHHRRQRRRELRRAAHAQVRRHDQPRPRRRAGAADGRASCSSAARSRTCPATISPGSSSAREGTFGIVTRATLRLVRAPGGVAHAARRLRVGRRRRARPSPASSPPGIVPAALEMMDRLIVAAVEAAFHFGFPTDAGAVLIVELDGPRGRARRAGARASRRVCRAPRRARGARRRRRGGARRALEEPQARLRRRRPAGAELLHAGRRRAAHEACRRSCAASPPSASATGCASPTSSTPATATSIRSCSTTSATPDEVRRVLAGRPRDPRSLRRARRQHHRRARHRRREDRRDAAPLQPAGSAGHARSCARSSTPSSAATRARSFRPRAPASRRRGRAGRCRCEQRHGGGDATLPAGVTAAIDLLGRLPGSAIETGQRVSALRSGRRWFRKCVVRPSSAREVAAVVAGRSAQDGGALIPCGQRAAPRASAGRRAPTTSRCRRRGSPASWRTKRRT